MDVFWSGVDNFQNVMISIGNVVEAKASAAGFNLSPAHYYWTFPTRIDRDELQGMVQKGIFPVFTHFATIFFYAGLLSLVRLILHHLVLKKFSCAMMGISLKPETKNKTIDKAFKRNAKCVPGDDAIETFAQTNKMNKNEVRNYLKVRFHNEVVNRKIVKFVEAFWRFLFYSTFFIIGYRFITYPKFSSWVFDMPACWENWPMQVLPDAMKFYYQVELGCYIHQLLWTEVSRSDAWEMIIHHLATIVLVGFSYLANFTRIGVVILMLHDSADIFLESAKVFNYISKNKRFAWFAKPACDILFAIFATVFFVTRLYLYPRYVLPSVWNDAMGNYGWDWAGSYIFTGLLFLLQFLHIFWFYLICRMIYKLVTSGIEGDVRSDDEDIEDDSVPKIANKKTK